MLEIDFKQNKSLKENFDILSDKNFWSPNGPARRAFRLPGRFIGRLGRPGVLLFYTLYTVVYCNMVYINFYFILAFKCTFSRSRPNWITGPGPKSEPAGKSESHGPENGVSRWRRPNSDIYSQNHHFGLVYDMIRSRTRQNFELVHIIGPVQNFGPPARNFGPLRAEFAWREWRKTLGGHVANWAGLSGFSPRENKISHTFFIDCINKYSKVSNAHNSDDCHGVFNGGMLNKGWSFSRSRFDCLGLMHFFHG